MKYQLVSAAVLAAPSVLATTTNPYATYPPVPHTASINGFADPIYAELPSCAQPCVEQNTDNTPCPYWDTGCLCVMAQFGGPVAECIASNCKGNDVSDATSLALSECSSAGVPSPYWFIPGDASSDLASAAAAQATTTSAAPETTSSSSSAASSPNQPEETSSSAPEESSAPETTAPPTTEPASSSAAPTTQPESSAVESSSVESSAAVESSEAAKSSAAESSAAKSSSAAESSSAAPSSVSQVNQGANNLPAFAVSVAAAFAAVALF